MHATYIYKVFGELLSFRVSPVKEINAMFTSVDELAEAPCKVVRDV
jgi:hypothetical protein